MQTFPVPSMILSTFVFEMMSVELIFDIQLETSFKAEILVKASFNCSNSLDFNGWEKSKLLIHLGKEILISSTGNS